MQIYLINICSFDEKDIDKLINAISITKLPNYKYFDDIKRFVLSEMFKYFGYKMYTGIDKHIEVKRGKNGKPYYSACEVFFNISHAGDYVAMAICDSEIGIDIEPNTYCNFDNLLDLFYPTERRQVQSGRMSFYELWCAKEAYLKYTGDGLSNGVDSCLILNEDKITVNDCNGKKIPCNIQKINIIDNYTIVVCNKEKNIGINTQILNKTIIMNYIKEEDYV